MAGKLPLKPTAVYGLLKEMRSTGDSERPLVVGGARELSPVLARELVRDGGDPLAVREGGTFERAAALVYIASGALTEADERELAAASRARVPIVLVAAGPGLGATVPYVLPTSIVRVKAGSGFPVEEIASVLAELLGENGIALAARLPVLREAVCDGLIARYARRNGIIGVAIFIPGADLPVLTLNQMRLVLRLARAHGHDVDGRSMVELAGVLGGALGFRALARELLKFVPVGGWAVKGAVAYGGTLTIGAAAVRYFEANEAPATPPPPG